MARIKGVDVPNNKRIEIALTYIYGIGRSLSNQILNDAKIDVNKKAGDLDTDELTRIRDEVNKYLTEGDLRREVNTNIKTKMEIVWMLVYKWIRIYEYEIRQFWYNHNCLFWF